LAPRRRRRTDFAARPDTVVVLDILPVDAAPMANTNSFLWPENVNLEQQAAKAPSIPWLMECHASHRRDHPAFVL